MIRMLKTRTDIAREIGEAGLNAILIVIGIPFEIPPRIPPELFVLVIIFPLLISIM